MQKEKEQTVRFEDGIRRIGEQLSDVHECLCVNYTCSMFSLAPWP